MNEIPTCIAHSVLHATRRKAHQCTTGHHTVENIPTQCTKQGLSMMSSPAGQQYHMEHTAALDTTKAHYDAGTNQLRRINTALCEWSKLKEV